MTAYYNEHDAFAAAWLRELIAAELIAPGDVDERDIQQVQADDLRKYTQCHFFAGIGGWSYALRLASWPDDRSVFTGSCPCQPLSGAGQRKGHADERHLWPAFHRLIAECRPAVVFGEQVAGALGYEWLAGVRADLEGDRYAVGAADLCAAGVGAPHIRQRLYWVADALRGRAGHCAGQGVGAQATPDGEDGRLSRERLRAGIKGASGSGLAYASRERCNGQSIRLRARRPQQAGFEAAGSGLCGRLANTDGRLVGHRDLQPSGQHGQQPQDDGVGRRLDDAASDGRREDNRHVDSPARRREGRGHAAWAGSTVWHPCTDGKARRIEPGIQPLAHGVSNRLGTLRGAGNAIVPQAAAEFVGAYLDVRAAA